MKREDWLSGCSLAVAVGSLMVAIISIAVSWQANSISQEAFKRASGRTLPIFTVTCNDQHLLVVGDKAVEPETMLVTIRNDGKEPIEAIRYEVLMDILWSGDRAKNQPIRPTRFDHEFNRILRPGQTASIDIAPEVAAHIKTRRIPRDKESFWTPCSVVFSAKIVGSTYFASATDDKNGNNYSNSCTFGVTWNSRPGVQSEPLNFGVELTPRK